MRKKLALLMSVVIIICLTAFIYLNAEDIHLKKGKYEIKGNGNIYQADKYEIIPDNNCIVFTDKYSKSKVTICGVYSIKEK